MGGSFARRLVIAVAVTLCAAAGFAIWAVLSGPVDPTALQGLGSALVGLVCVLAGLAGASVLDREDGRRSVGLVTILLAGLEFALALAAIWTGSGSDALGRALGMCGGLLAAFVHASLMLGRVRGDDGRALRSLTGAAVAFSMLGALVLSAGLALATGSPGGGYWRSLGVIAVLGTLFTLLALIARRLEARQAGEHDTIGDAQSRSSTQAVKPTGRSLMLGLQPAGR
jgi:MFS family permease